MIIVTSKVLFNINDLALILVISASIIFVNILGCKGDAKPHRYWLMAFVSCIALASLNNLLFWSPVLRAELRPLQPHLFVILQAALFAAPASLYVYTRSRLYKDFAFTARDLSFFAPLVLYILAIPIMYVSSGLADKHLGYQGLYEHRLFGFFIWLQHGVKLTYGLITLQLMRAHRSALLHTNSSMGGRWLRLLVMGFLALWLIQVVSQVLHHFAWLSAAQFFAVSSNYFLFGLVNLLVILSMTRGLAMANRQPPQGARAAAREFTDEQLRRLDTTMRQRQPYLKSDLSLEELAKLVSIPQRTLSLMINRHHNKNFFEYVNRHRIHCAAKLLREAPGLSMLDIMEKSGFNSKSAFNRFFKKVEGMTPSQYKLSQREQSPLEAE